MRLAPPGSGVAERKRGKSMHGAIVNDEVQHAAFVHARLLDGFIQATELEMAQQDDGFLKESLRELLEVLRKERRVYGAASGVISMMFPEIGNAA